ncbi:hypothetical protein [Candidatus Amarolinea dominans]|uniref:hypothetical protein n=1 Tax=Candidatus Amarolinea dominans TaxID=3140696 RepID=UPI0031CC4EEF
MTAEQGRHGVRLGFGVAQIGRIANNQGRRAGLHVVFVGGLGGSTARWRWAPAEDHTPAQSRRRP